MTLTNSRGDASGPICITLNGQKTDTGYHTDLQGGLILINGSHDNLIQNDQFPANAGISLGSGGNGPLVDRCTRTFPTFSPVEVGMGSGNTFTNVCFTSTNIVGSKPNPCK